MPVPTPSTSTCTNNVLGKQVKVPIIEKIRKIEAPPKTTKNVVIIYRKYDKIGLFH